MGDPVWSDVKNITTEIQHICDQVRPKVEKQIGHKCPYYDARCYRDQGDQIKNYSIKIYVGGNDEYAHLHAKKDLKEPEAEFLKVLYPMQEKDPLETF